VRALLEQGLSGAAIARKLGISKSTVSYHKRRLGHSIDVQRFYDAGHSITECQEHFGFARKTFTDAAARGAVTTRPQGAPLAVYLVAGRRTNRTHLKMRLLAEGLKENRCERCGISDWLGEPLMVALHHVNGDGLDNRIENLVMLCPNCHSQTDNFSGRGRRRLRVVA